MSDRQLGGLSTGEGLIWAVRDPVMGYERDKRTKELNEVMIDPGIGDKRLFVIESEFGSVLKRMSREGNTLSAIMRQAWDGLKLATMTKTSAAVATDAHISVIAHITRDELRSEMAGVENVNGFANRFLWVASKRSKMLPDGGDLDTVDFLSIRARLKGALDYAQAGSFGNVTRSDDARELWHEVYPELNADRPGALGAVTARAAAQVMRLALIYAVLDQSAIIRVEHLKAALAVWDYCDESAAYLFGRSTANPRDGLLAWITSKGGTVTPRELRQHDRKYPTYDAAEAALAELVAAGLGQWKVIPSGAAGGRPATVFILNTGERTAYR